MSVKTAAKIAQIARDTLFEPAKKLLARQGGKIYQNTRTNRPWHYGNQAQRAVDAVAGVAETGVRTARNNLSVIPKHMKEAEALRVHGISGSQYKVLKEGPVKIANIVNDPKSYTNGRVPKITNRKSVVDKMTFDAKKAMDHIEKDMHSIPYYVEGNLNKMNIIPKDNTVQTLFKEHFGKTVNLDEAKKLLGSNPDSKMMDILDTWGLDKKTKVIQMNNLRLNSLSQDVQMSPQFVKIAKALFSKEGNNKFARGKINSAREMVRYLQRKGIDAKRLGPRGSGEAVITFSPPRRSNFYTGGINGKVYINHKDPGHAYLMPSDVYDVFGGKTNFLTRKVLGMDTNQLNLMGVRRIKIPEIKSLKEVQNTVKKTVKNVNRTPSKFKGYSVDEFGNPIGIDPSQVNNVMAMTNKNADALQKMVQVVEDTPITKLRVAKAVTPLFATGITYKAITGDDEDDTKYDSYHAQANTEVHRINE